MAYGGIRGLSVMCMTFTDSLSTFESQIRFSAIEPEIQGTTDPQ